MVMQLDAVAVMPTLWRGMDGDVYIGKMAQMTAQGFLLESQFGWIIDVLVITAATLGIMRTRCFLALGGWRQHFGHVGEMDVFLIAINFCGNHLVRQGFGDEGDLAIGLGHPLSHGV